MSISVMDINRQICAALGVTDLSDVSKVTLELKPADLPVVTVTHLIFDSDVAPLVETLERFEILPALVET